MSVIAPPKQRYLAWVEEQIEDYKCSLRRDALLELADEAVRDLVHAPDGQYALTELLVCDAVDRLIFARLKLPTFRRWLRQNPSAQEPRQTDEPARGPRLEPG